MPSPRCTCMKARCARRHQRASVLVPCQHASVHENGGTSCFRPRAQRHAVAADGDTLVTPSTCTEAHYVRAPTCVPPYTRTEARCAFVRVHGGTGRRFFDNYREEQSKIDVASGFYVLFGSRKLAFGMAKYPKLIFGIVVFISHYLLNLHVQGLKLMCSTSEPLKVMISGAPTSGKGTPCEMAEKGEFDILAFSSSSSSSNVLGKPSETGQGTVSVFSAVDCFIYSLHSFFAL
ncbi:unnamed protein product [Fraxinus pennsylvanica]|uniref:Uncharacterized protein n=1 Tax=Fraxinus pennsylvanica TaxID=56036 RepID=A0AAD2A5F6_9LAMI|nr:unnamed protein product [Fraxinus pennsylvanica]